MLKFVLQMGHKAANYLNAILAGVAPGTITNSELNLSPVQQTEGGNRYYRVSNALAVSTEGAVFSVTKEVIRPNRRHETVIVTDGWYETLTPLTKVFILSHEQAHIDLGHFHPGLLSGDRTETIDAEYDADAKAAEHVGKRQAVRSLREVRRVVLSPFFTIDRERRRMLINELDKRILHIERTIK